VEEQRPPDIFTVAYEATASGVAETLADGRTPQKAVGVAQDAARLLDKMLSRLDQTHPPACRARCSWCCYIRVACKPPEAISVAAYIQTRLAKHVRRQLVAHLDAVCDQTRSLDSKVWARQRIPCPFLGDGMCLVHQARPLACRGWHSFDVEQCKRHWEDMSSMVDASGARLKLRGVVSNAVSDGLKRGGFTADSVDLAAAVRLVLHDPDTVAAWLRGEDALATVRWLG